MGNEPLCASDTRDVRSTVICGRQPEIRNSTAITLVNQIPVVKGPPLNFQKQQTFKKVEKSASQFCRENDLPFSYAPLVARIIAYGHDNLFETYRRLPENRKEQFLEEIKFIDIDFMDSLYNALILNERKKPVQNLRQPVMTVDDDSIPSSKRRDYIKLGRQLFARRQAGIMIMCAGSSSRFLFQNKFMYPLELKSNKTILQIYMERIRRNLGMRENEICDVPLIFACNSENRGLVESYLKGKNYFGFDVTKVRFIQIQNLPILQKKGKLCLSFESQVISRPSGTAKCVEEMLTSTIFQFLKNENVFYMHIVGTQNIVENPGDPFFIGYLSSNRLELVGKCTDSIFKTENFPRYVGCPDNKNYLFTVNDILNSKMPSNELQFLIDECPIAMNSIVCDIRKLKSTVKEYKNSMFLSKEYRALQQTQTYYNFGKQKPECEKKVYVFEKDIGHLFTCSQNHHLLKVNRSQFVPIISKNKEYSMKEACKKLIAFHEKELNVSKKVEDDSTA